MRKQHNYFLDLHGFGNAIYGAYVITLYFLMAPLPVIIVFTSYLSIIKFNAQPHSVPSGDANRTISD